MDEKRSVGKCIGSGVLCAFIAGWCCEVMTAIMLYYPSAGGLLTWVVGIAAGFMFRSRDSWDLASIMQVATIAGLALGAIVVIASLAMSPDYISQLAYYAHGFQGGDTETVYWRLIDMWAFSFSHGDYLGGSAAFVMHLLMAAALAMVIPAIITAVIKWYRERHG